MTWSIGVDVGGTFTDFFAFNEDSGQTHVGKRPSTPDDPGRAILLGLEELSGGAGENEGVATAFELGDVGRLAHGTTVATNALIQRKGAEVALVTTKGFRDLLEIGRQVRPHMYDLNRDFPPPLIPRERRFEIGERITADGAVHLPVDEDGLEAVIAALGASGVKACAVCFLFAFLNPRHEELVAERLRAALPDLEISLSSQVQPEFREYERFTTTVINAYLQPVLSRYVARLEDGLASLAPGAALGINQSSGGLMSPARSRSFPVRTALSGPAAGVVGALHVARRADRPNIITLDVGGTSADVALIRDGRAEISFERSVADFPIRLPMIDIHTIGAGGGSIAWFDRDDLLKVGPLSAGAVPGPACYGHGGQDPTVSDANLHLGRLASRLIDGSMTLQPDLAARSLAPIAERLGISSQRAAHGMLGILVANMVRAIRTISVERGHDPRGFTLMPFGGAGPLHARDVATSLGIREILVPRAPGIVCAQGLIVSDLKEDFVVSQRTPLDTAGLDLLGDNTVALLDRAAGWYRAESVPDSGRSLELNLDLRYVGQNFELTVPLAFGVSLSRSDLPDIDALRQRFFEAHDTAYGYFNADDAIEAVNLRLTARGRLYHEPEPVDVESVAESPAPVDHRMVFFAPDAAQETAVYHRDRLRPGQVLYGAAVIEQLDTTTLVYPGDRALVDASGNLLIEIDHDD